MEQDAVRYENLCIKAQHTSIACAPSLTASLLGRPIFTPPSARASRAVKAWAHKYKQLTPRQLLTRHFRIVLD